MPKQSGQQLLDLSTPLGKIAQSGAATSNIPKWNGSNWAPTSAEIVEAANQSEEDAAFAAGAKIVIRTDLL